MNRLLRLFSVVLLAFGLSRVALAQGGTAAYIGKVLTQRTFYDGKHIEFNEQMQAIGNVRICSSWTLCAEIRLSDVSVEGTLLRITGQRAFLAIGKAGPVDVLSDPSWKFASKTAKKKLTEMARVEIDARRAQPWDDAAVDRAMSQIFLRDDEQLADFVSASWKPYFCSGSPGKAGCSTDESPKSATKAGGVITPPIAKSTSDPRYSEVARLAGLQGSALLRIVITREGPPSNITVSQPIGLGLDDQAVSSVSHWKFRPATRDGEPIAVKINIQVNFRLD